MKPKRNAIIELPIEGLGPDGRGTGRMDEYQCLVGGALPGDRVQARVGRVRGRVLEAWTREILVSGVERRPAVCDHFGTCGGCAWQEIPYPEQVRLKGQLVGEALRGQGIDLPMAEPLAAESPYYYRNKMEFSFSEKEGRLILGLHLRGRFDRVFDLARCHLQSDASNRVVAAVRRFAAASKIPPYDLRAHRGFWRFLTVREGKSTGEVMVNLVTSEEPGPDLAGLAGEVLAAAPEVATLLHTVNRKKAQVATGEESKVLHGGGYIRERLGAYLFRISASSFFQTNPVQAERLYALVEDYARLRRGEKALDLYCGTGAIAMFLARQAEQVVGVESAPEAVRDALRNCAENGVENCRFVAGDATLILRQFMRQGDHFDAAVVDPPRPGMHPEALSALLSLRPPRIVYVSCNPEALGRDLSRLLAEGYRAEEGRLVDLFPQTAHCETVVRLTRG